MFFLLDDLSSHCSHKHMNYVVLSVILPVSWICPENLLSVISKGIRPLQKSVPTCLLFIPHIFQEVFYTIPASADPSHTLSFTVFIYIIKLIQITFILTLHLMFSFPNTVITNSLREEITFCTLIWPWVQINKSLLVDKAINNIIIKFNLGEKN